MTRVRSVFISDIHLGTPTCKADALQHFLRNLQCETLYLVGDIIDLWQLQRGGRWPRGQEQVLAEFWRLSQQGTRIIYIPGNHDAPCRALISAMLGAIEIHHDFTHITAKGRRFWVTHGDQFDAHVQMPQWLTGLGDRLCTTISQANHWFNSVRKVFGRPYWSLANQLKRSNGKARIYIERYEQAVARETHLRGFDGVICGHIHFPVMKDVSGVIYANDGDWVDSCSALIETLSGEIHLIFPKSIGTAIQEVPALAEVA